MILLVSDGRSAGQNLTELIGTSLNVDIIYSYIYMLVLILSLESSNIRKKKKSHVRYLTMLLNIARIAQSKD